jgi:predicted TIM-barrel fold metal-dependent hydrolase
MRRIYFDIVSPLPEAMRFALDFTSADHLLYSSDHPWVDPALIIDCLKSLQISPEEERRILGDNARRLFNL